ncbi:zinc finger protein 367 isoform X2 [Pelodiscus sinensis]|uniref:zinc finger protein 367 isoform X2 n=1 Tax=Pelodiscus sinensis TaxID=13735 RepID=UPI003F6C0A83
MAERPPPGPPVIFCQDSPKRVLVSVIKTTPIKPSRGGEEAAPAPPVPTSPGFSDFMVYPWRWGENAHNVTLSPGSTAAPSSVPQPRGGAVRASSGEDEEAGSPDSGGSSSHLKDGIRRGRPRADTVRDLISEGEHSSSRIRCNICNRVFPREKSLQAHKRTHTGCLSRFTHANRHCPKHPYARLKREEPTGRLSKKQTADNKAVAEWLAKYWETREQRTPTLKSKTTQKADQEQQDPMEYLQSDEEDDEEKNRSPSAARRRLQEQRERLHGALALIELANLAGAPLRP